MTSSSAHTQTKRMSDGGMRTNTNANELTNIKYINFVCFILKIFYCNQIQKASIFILYSIINTMSTILRYEDCVVI